MVKECDEGDNPGEMSPGSSTESYLVFAHIGLRENPGKNLNQVTCPDRESNPGSPPDALTVTPQNLAQDFHCKFNILQSFLFSDFLFVSSYDRRLSSDIFFCP
ncbi:hypothetical protein ANN_26510 [Periplaneta americana]|uniref:Uncharacterized protein n=1 Tax=Periplaneta americana TaxID=6978 RepID=A0ABQ8RYH3_PERAM|nr:hypothetical protein ANN_26510 [Periplaneta americana]